jgi:hypothetical protein
MQEAVPRPAEVLRAASASSGIIPPEPRRDGRVAEGGGLLNRYRVKSSIGGSNPPLSAIHSHNLFVLIFLRLSI